MPRYFFVLLILLTATSTTVSIWYHDILYSVNIAILQFGALFGVSKLPNQRYHYRYLTAYISLIYLSEIVSAFSAYFLHTNMYISHVVLPLQTILISIVLFGILGSDTSRRKWLLSISILVMFIIGNSIYHGIDQFSSIGIIVFSFFIIIGSLFTLKKMTLSSSNLKLRQHPDFWFSIGGLVFYSITFFIYSYLWMPGIKPEWTYKLIMYANVFMSISYLLSITNEVKFNKEL